MPLHECTAYESELVSVGWIKQTLGHNSLTVMWFIDDILCDHKNKRIFICHNLRAGVALRVNTSERL